MTPNLLPCPFCGSKPFMAQYSSEETSSWVEIDCTDCGARMGGMGGPVPPAWTVEDACLRWNARAETGSDPAPTAH